MTVTESADRAVPDVESAGQPCVALGVTGSIAAYKAADLTSKLVQGGVDVHVLMTASATRLVQAQTFLTLSRNPVITDLWAMPQWQPGHIALADRASVLAVVPATANFIGKLAHGIADDALSTYALSHAGAVVVAPAMNPRMWQHPAVVANCRILRDRGVTFVGPDSGRVACGAGGTGRLADVDAVAHAIRVELCAARLRQTGRAPLRVLVTAGPTREALDPARFLSNRSSGRMGYAVAEVAAAAGCDTTLVSGPTMLTTPANCACVRVTTAAEMADTVREHFPACDVLVMCAAVADYRPAAVNSQKMKKTGTGLSIALERTEDILGSIAAVRRPDQMVMGFAAETENVQANAERKLAEKNLDWIVANDVSRADAGFEADTNQVTILGRDGTVSLPTMSKLQVAERLIDLVLQARS